MIHYILLPKEEQRALRREYRLRLAIVAFLFVSCAVVLGTISLIPAYFFSREQVLEAKVREEVLERSRRESGADKIEKELLLSQAIAEKILSDANPLVYGDVIQKILSHRTRNLSLASFTLIGQNSTTTKASVTVAGRAGTREALLDFKKALESDSMFTGVELPLSDLAKNKNITFEVSFKVKSK